MNALIVVDVQRDFVDGSLAVTGGADVAARIHDYVQKHDDEYVVVVATRCWHPNRMTFPHFSETPDFVDTWPAHCIAFSEGAQFAPELNAYDPFETLGEETEDTIEFDQIFYKGQKGAAYSGFEGVRVTGVEVPNASLKAYLDERRIRHVDIVGIATDYCVKATALDALKAGYDTTVLLNMCAAVAPESGEAAKVEMTKKGVHVEVNA